MQTQAKLDAAYGAARAWIDQAAGFYAGMISDSDVRKLCQVILDAAEQSKAQTQEKT